MSDPPALVPTPEVKSPGWQPLARLTRRVPASLLKLFSSAVLDQILVSGASFAVGFGLIRFTTYQDYGIYVLVASVQQSLTAFQRSWLSGPLAIVTSRKSAEERIRSVGAVRKTQHRVLALALVIAQAGVGLGYLLGWLKGSLALVAAGGLLAWWASLRREFLRDVLLMYSRPHSLLRTDALYALVFVSGVAFAIFASGATLAWVIVTLFVAAMAGAMVSERMLSRSPGWIGEDARAVLREMRPLGIWGTVGALTYWLYTQTYNYILLGRVDLKAVADVNATRLILMPIILVSVGVQALLMPMAAGWYAQLGLRPLMRRLYAFVLGIAVLDLIYVAVIWLARFWVTGTLLHKHIADLDQLLILWAGVALIGLARDILQCALFALGRLKSMAHQGALCAAVGLLLTWFGLDWWGVPAVLIGQIAGEVINLAGIGLLLREAYRSLQQPTAAEGGAAATPAPAAGTAQPGEAPPA